MAGSVRDRTSEWRSIASRSGLQGGVRGSSAASGAASADSAFARKASAIGMGIHACSGKLARLAGLAKRTSMFDDPAREIAELTGVIKQDIAALNGAIGDLQNLARGQQAGAGGNQQTNAHSATVVNNLKSKLMGATKQFKDVLTVRNDNLKVQESRRSRFAASPSKLPAGDVRQPLLGSPSPMANSSRYAHTSTAQATAGGEPPRGGGGGGGGGGAGPGPGSLAQPHLRRRGPTAGHEHQNLNKGATPPPHSSRTPGQPPGPPVFGQAQSQALIPANASYVSARSEAIQQVESTIHELGGIFNQLAEMVQQQGELAVRIDENVDEALGNVEGAQGQLLKYLDRISGNRWLILKVLGVVLFFLLIFVLFVV